MYGPFSDTTFNIFRLAEAVGPSQFEAGPSSAEVDPPVARVLDGLAGRTTSAHDRLGYELIGGSVTSMGAVGFFAIVATLLGWPVTLPALLTVIGGGFLVGTILGDMSGDTRQAY